MPVSLHFSGRPKLAAAAATTGGALLAALGVAHAQTGIVAGQVSGLQHQVLTPERVLTSALTYAGGNTPLNTRRLDSLDVDADGRFEVFLATDATLQAGKYPIASAVVWIRGGEILKTQTTFRPTAVALPSGAPIKDSTLPFVPGSSAPTWAPATIGGYTDPELALALEASNPGGLQQLGEWRDGAPHYVGFRLGTASAGYRYGWLLLQASVLYSGCTLRAAAYAVQPRTALPAQPAAELAAFRAGPNPVLQTLHLQVPAAGLLHIHDALGRRYYGQPTGAGPLQLDVAGWPAGLYFASLTTDNGRVVHRLLKQ
ncbi:T9SS C-terminal target domain-containing protein [Hymenobacter oligotrophus]|uniref:T9SS C-terminal target domain-containing protein n=1 Tax=Hymenobacter oligotrophus TaxID=2319843 RepID=A0A3B7QZG7_9BACT|nr:T9SS type A sorting domain-containing protein [Hymenobacter oligotrophus]AYA37264.1 T9SS C-terminal target domain-containing protein [Hymenobacter oligotrophus]